MNRRLRLSLLVTALVLTGMITGTMAPAQECSPGEYSWEDFGSCCPYLNAHQLLRAVCVDGYWAIDTRFTGYKCTSQPCW